MQFIKCFEERLSTDCSFRSVGSTSSTHVAPKCFILSLRLTFSLLFYCVDNVCKWSCTCTHMPVPPLLDSLMSFGLLKPQAHVVHKHRQVEHPCT